MQSLGPSRLRPMHEMVSSNLHTRLLSSLRLSSFAGKGLPERMRTTAFAFLGLTAAAALALVAIFAQLSFPLLSPAPLPSDPSQGDAVAEAVPVESAKSAPASVDRIRSEQTSGSGGADAPSQEGASAGGNTGPGGSGAVEAPAPGGSPGATPPGGVGAGGGQPGAAPAPDPVPAPVPELPSSPESVPTAEAPVQSAGPGRSSSSAAAGNASARGIEASAKQPAPAPSASASSTAPTSPPAATPGNGNAKGHDE